MSEGRGYPRKFKTEKEFEEKFKEYIKYCKKNKLLANVAGFSVYMDMNQDTFYAQKEYYSETFKKVNTILEDFTINSKDVNDTFKIFYMKNKFNYKDRQDLEHHGEINNPFAGMSTDELRKIINAK